MNCVGVTYQTADAVLRGRLALPPEVQGAMLKALCPPGAGREAALLCTCNRTELYFRGFSFDVAGAALAEAGRLPLEDLSPHLRRASGKAALTHLFRVASGLKSLVLGEDEILGQVKDAYRYAREAGTAGHEIHGAFRAAIMCAKRVRSGTDLSKTPISTATLAAHAAVKAGPDILVIGASGKIGGAVVKHLLSHAEARVIATERRHGGHVPIGEPAVHVIDYAARYAALETCDAVISATSSPHLTLTREGLAGRERPLLVIDLAVPRDVDPSVAELPGVTLLSLDDFARLSDEQRERRVTAAAAAEALVAESVTAYRRDRILRAYRARAS